MWFDLNLLNSINTFVKTKFGIIFIQHLLKGKNQIFIIQSLNQP